VVEALVAAVSEAYPRLSHRYYALKARWFGSDALDFWDRNAPLPRVAQRTIPWDEARETVLSAYADFSPRWADIARRFFDDRWIDAPVRPGKAPGAFAHPTVPSAHPYVLLNYQGKPRDVMTLAHGTRSRRASGARCPNGALMAPTPLTLAETASVFGEMLTFRRLLEQTTTEQRKAMLAGKVEDMINTVVRQIAFYSFERKVHTRAPQRRADAEQLGELWMSVQARASARDPARPATRLLDLHPALHPFAVLRLRLRLRRLPRELVVRRLPERFARLRRALFRHALGRRHEAHSELLAPFGP
jgi:oligoendopeptidase F